MRAELYALMRPCVQVEELKVALELLGEPGDGNRYALTEQLTRVVMRLQLQWRAEADAANTALSVRAWIRA